MVGRGEVVKDLEAEDMKFDLDAAESRKSVERFKEAGMQSE